MLRFHEDRLDEAEELFSEARTLCKSAGDRVSEYQATEYLVMVELAARPADARRASAATSCWCSATSCARAARSLSRAPWPGCATTRSTTSRRGPRGGARRPARRRRQAPPGLRADARRADRLRARAAAAATRRAATEALAYATQLDRATEMLLANAVLSRDCSGPATRPVPPASPRRSTASAPPVPPLDARDRGKTGARSSAHGSLREEAS